MTKIYVDNTRKFGKLRIKVPQELSLGSHKKVLWICDCGKEEFIQISHVILSDTISCGRCNEISVEKMSVMKFGKLCIKDPQSIMPGSAKKVWWVCDCGRETLAPVNSVLSGKSSSCGRCNEISTEEMNDKKFGKLRIKHPCAILPGSHKKVYWVCDCGREFLSNINSVISGKTASCGHCYEKVYNWYLENKEKIKLLKCPFGPEDFPPGGPKPLEIIKNSRDPFKWLCYACKKEYHPRFDGIKYSSVSLTCGCSYSRVSKGQKNVADYIKSLGFSYILEHPVNKLKYDIFVPKCNLLIEYQGTKWHSTSGSKERDLRKQKNALCNGYKFFAIYESEWSKSRSVVEQKLKDLILTD